MRAPHNASPADDTDALLAAFDDLTLATPNKAEPRPLRSLSPIVPKAATVKAAPDPDEDQLYFVSSPAVSGYTDSWDEAAALTQGIPGASPRKLSPKKKSRARPQGYAVFFGRLPGAYRTWAEAEPHVKRVSGNIYQSYPLYEQAVAAVEYARERGWTRVCPAPSTSSSAIGSLPTPIPAGSHHHPNPLHVAGDPAASHQGVWYVVYSGVTPGVYQSSLEFSLNTVGIKAAVFDSCGSRAIAERRFDNARAEGRTEVLTPMYRI
ncbi:hypothetical protein DFH06DRAFT_1340642 [Mycena polygramma]|nr:hypothetical protein DFH06DRAFT_1340642 [Mycena polygramma]